MLRSTAIKIAQNNAIINQNKSLLNRQDNSNALLEEQIKATNKQSESIDNVTTQLKESNKPTINIKLDEYETLKEKSLEYEKIIDSISRVLSYEDPSSLGFDLLVFLNEKMYNKFLFDILKTRKEILRNSNVKCAEDLDRFRLRFEKEVVR